MDMPGFVVTMCSSTKMHAISLILFTMGRPHDSWWWWWRRISARWWIDSMFMACVCVYVLYECYYLASNWTTRYFYFFFGWDRLQFIWIYMSSQLYVCLCEWMSEWGGEDSLDLSLFHIDYWSHSFDTRFGDACVVFHSIPFFFSFFFFSSSGFWRLIFAFCVCVCVCVSMFGLYCGV